MKKFHFGIAALAFLALAAAMPAPAMAGNTTFFSSTQGDVVVPLSPPTNSGATPGRLDNTAIGVTTPAPGHFTTISGTGSISGPVAATTLSASGAVTGAGFTALLASPPAIGGTAPAAGAFTSVTGTSLLFSGTAPTPTGTGSPTIAAGSTDSAGEVTAGSSATSVVITFATAKTNAPFCVVGSQTQLAAFAYSISTTAITVTQTATSGNKIDYHCVQH